MFNVDPSELMLVAFVALVVIGPKDLPKAMRIVGYWVGRARGVARQFRQGFDTMVREAELAEMEKKWAEENERIMREHANPAPEPVAGVAAIDDTQEPVMVEQPHVSPAPEGTPPHRGDGVTS
ncbi:Sec-independent protein translocase protein TatB [Sphingomonas aerophila]|jgi:sec-independent protein translocase protein TatB|uniref:Sec-independent protein translocase protein TatB n=1 Tax=Sphingomonas aerophila TaxID=1344948 RepID=A0A7W9EWQ8_9SPHN|nr:Sec-independent protein translocase protein TatB [Sphingomonas aerophila]MBB5715793.1 sec-independent protein translocase protein TatB [Sphingomonas aerophila]